MTAIAARADISELFKEKNRWLNTTQAGTAFSGPRLKSRLKLLKASGVIPNVLLVSPLTVDHGAQEPK